MMLAINTCFENSLLIKITISNTDAPSTLRIPISLVRFCALNAARPKSPRQAIKIDKIVKMIKNFKPWRFSFIYPRAVKVVELPVGMIDSGFQVGDELEVSGV